MEKFLREPLLHFAVLGLALFLAYGWLSGRGIVSVNRIVITQGRIEQLAAGFESIHQRPPSVGEMDGMIDDEIREEVYSREAKSMGLDRDDIVIRRRLMTKLQFLSEDTAPIAEPTDAQLLEYLDAHAADFRVERHYSFTHVYLSPQRHADHLGVDVQALLAQLHRNGTADASELGDPFLLDLRFDGAAAGEVARRFGADFETALRTLPIGVWSGPISSSYGTHIVLIRERADERTATLGDVRDDVRGRWMQEQREQANDRRYADFRKRYKVTVERSALAHDSGASTSPATASR